MATLTGSLLDQIKKQKLPRVSDADASASQTRPAYKVFVLTLLKKD